MDGVHAASGGKDLVERYEAAVEHAHQVQERNSAVREQVQETLQHIRAARAAGAANDHGLRS